MRLSVFPEWLERTADLILRARADPAPPGERQPVPRSETEHDRYGHECHRGQSSSHGHEVQP